METERFELLTPCLQGRCSPNCATPPFGTKTIFFFYKSGSHLLSHAVPSIVPSAAYVLTFVFGMWTGVSHKRIATRNFYIFILFYKEVRFTKLVLRSSLVLVKFLRTKFALTSCFALARIR